jgi:hypothetical protein
MEEPETQNTAFQCNTSLKGGNPGKSDCHLFATFAIALLCVFLQELKIQNSCKWHIYRSLL